MESPTRPLYRWSHLIDARKKDQGGAATATLRVLCLFVNLHAAPRHTGVEHQRSCGPAGVPVTNDDEEDPSTLPPFQAIHEASRITSV